MIIERIAIRNVRSFRDKVEIEFGPGLNLIVGPNGGGKSNLLDILTVILRRYFLVGFRVQESSDDRGLFWNLEAIAPFNNVAQLLERFSGNEEPPEIDIRLVPQESDLANIAALKREQAHLTRVMERYRNARDHGLEFIDRWDLDNLRSGVGLEYRIRDNQLQFDDTPSHNMFYQYLRQFELLSLISQEHPTLRLTPCFLYFSPFRGGGGSQSFQANLSATPASHLLTAYFGATSRSVTSLIGVATTYFAEKRRRLEAKASNNGYEDAWAADEEVKLVTKFLAKIGYDWRLDIVNEARNVYEISVTKNGATFDIGRASSGEQEIINFILGIFALNLKDGILVVDEAELHLHPRWQSLLLDLFFEVHEVTSNQLVVTTHSGTFLTPRSISHVIRIFKDNENVSRVVRIDSDKAGSLKDTLHVVNTHNNERMFFADAVVLVEGIMDRLLYERMLGLYQAQIPEVRIVEVLEVHGKSQFARYHAFLEAVGLVVYEIGDFDYVFDMGKATLSDLFVHDNAKLDRKVLKNKKSQDRQGLSDALDSALESNDLTVARAIWDYIKTRHQSLRTDIDEAGYARIEAFFVSEEETGRFFLRKGEIEDYLPNEARLVEGLVELMRPAVFETWVLENWDTEPMTELKKITRSILNVGPDVEAAVLTSLRGENAKE